MELNEFLKHLNSKYKYVSDQEKYGFKEHWSELPEDFEGDCEDYCLTIQAHFGGDLYFATYKGSGHCVLKLKDDSWIDNITKRPVNQLSDDYVIKFKYYWPIRFIKKLQAKLQQIFGA